MRKRSFKRPPVITFQSRRLTWIFILNAIRGLTGEWVRDNYYIDGHGGLGWRPVYRFESAAACELMMSFCKTHGITAMWTYATPYAPNTIEFLGGWMEVTK